MAALPVQPPGETGKHELGRAEAPAPAAEAALRTKRRLARSTAFNLIGESAPVAAAVFAVPLLVRGLGTDRFGLLTLAWMVVGYFSLFDFGLGRALTKLVAEKLGARQEAEIPALVWTALLLMLLLGVAGALALGAASPFLVYRVLKMPDALRPETVRAFVVLALSVPLVIASTGLRGLLEAAHRFDLTNAVRTPTGVFAFVGPLLVLPFSSSLVPVVSVLAAGRLVTFAVYMALCLRVMPALRHSGTLQASAVRPLFRFGSWMTVSNVVSPLMTTFDRFVIGALLSAQAVAYYATPYDVTSKMLVLPGALVGVLFPTFSAELGQDRERVTRLFGRAVKYVFLAIFPIALVVVALAHEGLRLWLGAEFARHSAPVLQWLAVGILINSLALVPFTLIQGAGRPDVTAKLHLAELPLYLAAIVALTRGYGIVGAAVASVSRITADALLLFVIARRLLRFRVPARLVAGLAAAALLTLLGFGGFAATAAAKVLALVLALVGFASIAWLRLLTPEERALATWWSPARWSRL
jgi:O-antigen/teichoic acid export membrane protein